MSKIYYTTLAWLLPGLVLAGGCSDEFEYKDERTIEVVSSDLEFGRDASAGAVTVRSATPFAATVDKDWCKVFVRDSIVTVSVSENSSHDDRAAVLTLTNSDDQLNLSVTQSCSRFDFASEASYSLGDEAETIDIAATLDFDYTITLPDWIAGERTESGYRLNVSENDSGYPRNSTVWITSDNTLISFTVSQFGANDIAGAYDASYSALGGSGSLSKSVTVSRVSDVGNDFIIEGLSGSFSIPVVFDNDDKSLKFNNLTRLGQDTDTTWTFLLCTTTAGNIPLLDGTYDSTSSLTGSGGVLKPTFTFNTTPFYYETIMGTYSWSVEGFLLGRFDDPDLSYANYIDFNESFMRLALVKN